MTYFVQYQGEVRRRARVIATASRLEGLLVDHLGDIAVTANTGKRGGRVRVTADIDPPEGTWTPDVVKAKLTAIGEAVRRDAVLVDEMRSAQIVVAHDGRFVGFAYDDFSDAH